MFRISCLHIKSHQPIKTFNIQKMSAFIDIFQKNTSNPFHYCAVSNYLKKKKKLNKSRFKKRLAYQVLSLILYWYKCNFKRPVPARFFISKVLLSEKSLRLSNLDVECSDFWMLIIS